MGKKTARPGRVLAVASGGGHWIQLLRLSPAWDGMQLTYATTVAGVQDNVARIARDRDQPLPRIIVIPDANRWQKIRLLRLLAILTVTLLRTRPDIVVTTGAAPGYFALRLGRMLGARTIWVDSIANAGEISMAGQLARPYADHWLSQWPDVAAASGATFEGAVL